MERINQINNISAEVLGCLEYFDNDLIEKIPSNIINKLKELAVTSTYHIEIDASKRLMEQNISEECKDFIALMYYSYIANEEEKDSLKIIWKENENKYQEEIRKKYNPNNIFKTKETVEEKEIIENNLPVIEEKRSVINRIIERIKRLFKKS